MITNEEIDILLYRVSLIICDIESIPLPWSEIKIAGFIAEWGYACSSVSDDLFPAFRNGEMTQEQQALFLKTQARYLKMEERIKALDLKNPFLEQDV